MNESEARSLVARLAAAFPATRLDAANVALYSERIAALPDYGCAYAVVDRLIDTEERLPPIARLREAYRAEDQRRRMDMPALELPPITEEQRRVNLRRAAELIATVWPEDAAA